MILLLNEKYETLCNIAPINVQWNRKYYEVGNYSIVIPKEQYNSEAFYLCITDRKELGLIEKVVLDDNEKTITLSGDFFEKRLNERVTYPTYVGNNEISLIISELYMQYTRGLFAYTEVFLSPSFVTGTTLALQSTGEELATKMYSLGQTQQISFRFAYDYTQNKFTFDVFQGLDRTQDQIDNNFIVFSKTFKNVSDVLADMDKSNEKNYILVAGQDSADNRVVEIVDLTNGNPKKELWIDARDLQQQDGQSLEDYRLNLKQRGLEKVLDYQKVTNISFNANTSSYKYMEDYDIGDKCDIIIEELDLKIQARIIAIYEVYKNNNFTVELEFGDKILTRLDRLERK